MSECFTFPENNYVQVTQFQLCNNKISKHINKNFTWHHHHHHHQSLILHATAHTMLIAVYFFFVSILTRSDKVAVSTLPSYVCVYVRMYVYMYVLST